MEVVYFQLVFSAPNADLAAKRDLELRRSLEHSKKMMKYCCSSNILPSHGYCQTSHLHKPAAGHRDLRVEVDADEVDDLAEGRPFEGVVLDGDNLEVAVLRFGSVGEEVVRNSSPVRGLSSDRVQDQVVDRGSSFADDLVTALTVIEFCF